MKVLGFTEENTACDLCGKTELKGTYAIEDDNGTIYYLGSTCIKNKYALNQKEFTAKVNEAKEERIEERRLFLLDTETNFRNIAGKYPNTNKYTPEAEGYTEFMKAKKELEDKRKECDIKLPKIK
jgi:hypothetical protein